MKLYDTTVLFSFISQPAYVGNPLTACSLCSKKKSKNPTVKKIPDENTKGSHNNDEICVGLLLDLL